VRGQASHPASTRPATIPASLRSEDTEDLDMPGNPPLVERKKSTPSDRRLVLDAEALRESSDPCLLELPGLQHHLLTPALELCPSLPPSRWRASSGPAASARPKCGVLKPSSSTRRSGFLLGVPLDRQLSGHFCHHWDHLLWIGFLRIFGKDETDSPP
jgi:hypothetical protein